MATTTYDAGDNPYASPLALADAPPSPQRFRWRVIPTLLTGLYGVSGAACGFLGIVVAAVGWVAGGVETDAALLVGAISVGGAVDGVVWFLAARSWWRGRWWRALLLTVLAYGPVIIATCLLESYPPWPGP